MAFALPAAPAAAQDRLEVVLDTDLGWASDDAMALLILLQSEKVDLHGVTVVTGNDWLEQEVANALRLLEIAGRPSLPVFRGAERPLLTSQAEMLRRERLYGDTSEGGYKGAWREGGPGPEEISPPDGRFAERSAEEGHAVDFLIETIRENPGEIVLVAVGPLTNVALALKKDPGMASLAKEIVIMGGGIDTAPEFNFWMDPEAARIVLRAPWPKLTLTPLNISEQAPFTREVAEAAAQGNSAINEYFSKTFLTPERLHAASPLMYDQIAVLALIEPDLVTRSETLWIDVDIDHGPSYGRTLTWSEGLTPPPGTRQGEVQFDLDYPRFMETFLELMKR